MCLRTGNILEGYRICLLDKTYRELDGDFQTGPWQVGILTTDGWIVSAPGMGTFFVFMNAEWVAKEFENLGEI